jgi:hypothetical protein
MRNTSNELKVGDKIKSGPWEGFELVSKYTSEEAFEDGFLFDVDLLIKAKKYIPAGECPIKYITTSVLALGYWNDRCKNAVVLKDAGKADRCGSCDVWIKRDLTNEGKLSCLTPTLNIPNILDLLMGALKIFRKKSQDDYFVSGKIELPNGDKQTVYIAQNETGRYTLMLPEDD